MTAVINIWTTDGVSRTFRQTDFQEVRFILECIRQPGRMFGNTTIISTPLCTSLISGNMIARIELISYDPGIRSLLTDHAIDLISLEPGADSQHDEEGGSSESTRVRIDFRLLGGMTLSAMTKRKALVDILQPFVGNPDVDGIYYNIGEAGIGLIQTRTIAGIEVHSRQLDLPEDTWHAEDLCC